MGDRQMPRNKRTALGELGPQSITALYEKLGFAVFGGSQSQNSLITPDGEHNIGLFQGMFDKNILTFNPG
jgi:hypothetical protein